jgi:malonyl-CoA O-methyltransferase
MTIDKEFINMTFSEAAKTYDLWAKHQHLAAAKLIKLLPNIHVCGKILDAGCGTGLLTRMAYNHYNDATFLGIDISEQMINYCQTRFGYIKNMCFLVHDLEKLNEVNFSLPFDLMLSSFTFQWITNTEYMFETLVDSLIPGGYLGIAVPVKDSLFELYNSFNDAFNTKMPGLSYRNPDYYIAALQKHSVFIHTSQVEDICIFFYGIDILRYFKYTGTTFRHNPSYRPKTIREINRLLAHYEKNYGGDNKLLPLTFKVLFIIAQKHNLT